MGLMHKQGTNGSQDELSLESKQIRLKLSYFGHLIRRSSSLEKDVMLGKVEGRGKGKCRGDGYVML